MTDFKPKFDNNKTLIQVLVLKLAATNQYYDFMKKLLLLLTCVTLLYSCDKNEDTPTDKKQESVEITINQTEKKNVYILSANLTHDELKWDIGKNDGQTLMGNNVTARYPYKGTYTITLYYKSEDNQLLSITKELNINEDNLSLIDEDMDQTTLLLTGGTAFPDGKIWVVDSLTIGHLGKGPVEVNNPSWWIAQKLEKSEEGIYDDELLFKFDGTFGYINHGTTNCANNAEAELATRGAISTGGGYDKIMEYRPNTSGWKWNLIDLGSKKIIDFPNNEGFLSYYTSEPHQYEIIKVTENSLYVRQEIDEEAWYFKFIPKGYDKPYLGFDDYESDVLDFNFIKEYLGDGTGFNIPNPFPSEKNSSSKVACYDRKAEQWGRLAYYDVTKFDLTKYNKISMKVYCPSSNNYTNNLKAKVSIKLQDCNHGSPWETQAERSYTDLSTDQWIDLVFDFSDISQRTDLDIITVQFGDEGHFETGIFYFDDFKFYK